MIMAGLLAMVKAEEEAAVASIPLDKMTVVLDLLLSAIILKTVKSSVDTIRLITLLMGSI